LAGDPEHEIIRAQPNGVVLSEKSLPQSGRWSFPPASVSAVELDVVSQV
jgi:hypothetical protein